MTYQEWLRMVRRASRRVVRLTYASIEVSTDLEEAEAARDIAARRLKYAEDKVEKLEEQEAKVVAELYQARLDLKRIVDAQPPYEPPIEPPVVPPEPPPEPPEPPEPPPEPPASPVVFDALSLVDVTSADEAKARLDVYALSRQKDRETRQSQRIEPSVGPPNWLADGLEDLLVVPYNQRTIQQTKVYLPHEDQPQPVEDPVVLRNLEADHPVDRAQENWQFFFRVGNLPKLTVEQSMVFGRTVQGRQKPIEHAIYADIYGDSTARDLYFRDLGGHGWYMTHRPDPYDGYTPETREWAATSGHVVERCTFIDCDQDAQKGAHAITLYDMGNNEFPASVLIKDSQVLAAWPYVREQGYNQRYPIGEVPPEAWNPIRANSCVVMKAYQRFGVDRHTVERFRMENCVLWTVQANRQLVDLHNAKRLDFVGCLFRAQDHRKPILDIGAERGDERTLGPQMVVFEDCFFDGVGFEIWSDYETVHKFDSLGDLRGKRWTWTPDGVTTEDL